MDKGGSYSEKNFAMKLRVRAYSRQARPKSSAAKKYSSRRVRLAARRQTWALSARPGRRASSREMSRAASVSIGSRSRTSFAFVIFFECPELLSAATMRPVESNTGTATATTP